MADVSEIAVLGGTGPLGRGVAARLAIAGQRVWIGSRAQDRAVAAVESLRDLAGADADLRPAENAEAVERAEIVIVAVPYEGQAATLEAIEPAPGTLVVNAVNPMVMDEIGPVNVVVPGGSAAEENQIAWPRARVVAAFKEIPARRLLDVASAVDCDLLVAGEDAAAAEAVEVIGLLPGARGLVCGPLRQARYLEALTPLLVGLNRRYRAHAALRVVGLD